MGCPSNRRSYRRRRSVVEATPRVPSGHPTVSRVYQFSPELMFRVMSEQNSLQMMLSRIGLARFPSIEKSSGHCEVTDPNTVRSHIGVLSSRSAYPMVMARKTHEAEGDASAPQTGQRRAECCDRQVRGFAYAQSPKTTAAVSGSGAEEIGCAFSAERATLSTYGGPAAWSN